jgi:hypothetical protein
MSVKPEEAQTSLSKTGPPGAYGHSRRAPDGTRLTHGGEFAQAIGTIDWPVIQLSGSDGPGPDRQPCSAPTLLARACQGTARLAAINGAVDTLAKPLAAELAPRQVKRILLWPGGHRWWSALARPDCLVLVACPLGSMVPW